MTRRTRRRGYALIMVVLFVTLYLSLWSVAARQVATMLRIEQARSQQINRDAAALPAIAALAQGLEALEVGYPPASPYVVAVSGTSFSLIYTQAGASQGGTSWTVQVVPTTDQVEPTDPNHPDLDPSQFQPTSPPG